MCDVFPVCSLVSSRSDFNSKSYPNFFTSHQDAAPTSLGCLNFWAAAGRRKLLSCSCVWYWVQISIAADWPCTVWLLPLFHRNMPLDELGYGTGAFSGKKGKEVRVGWQKGKGRSKKRETSCSLTTHKGFGWRLEISKWRTFWVYKGNPQVAAGSLPCR